MVFTLLAAVFGLVSIAKAEYAPFISVNKGSGVTKIRAVSLFFNGPKDTRQMMVSNKSDFVDAKWEPYYTSKQWTLDYGAGVKTVYVKFKDSVGKVSEVYKGLIVLQPPAEMGVEFKINKGDKETDSRYAQLTIKYSEGVEGMIISNSQNFSELYFEPVKTSSPWALTKNSGSKTVYIQFKDANGKTKTLYQKIKYNQPENYIDEGGLLKGQGSTVYYLGEDGKLHPFINSLVYHSWYSDFKNIKYVSDSRLKQYEVGQPVCLKAGTWLVKFSSWPMVYAVEPGCQLRPILSEGEAVILYGSQWSKRVLEFDAPQLSHYRIRSYSVADKEKEIVDKDRDGVDKEEEAENGTSDMQADSDSDGLTDYEEIYYWYSDPTLADTDSDGHKDGQELVNGYPPTGGVKMTKIPAGTYEYPYGAVFKTKNGNYYYHNSNGKIYSIGSKTDTRLLKSNNFDKNFAAESPYTISFKAESGKQVASKENALLYPTVYIGDKLTKL